MPKKEEDKSISDAVLIFVVIVLACVFYYSLDTNSTCQNALDALRNF